MDSFFTWTDLMTYGGAVMAVLIITEFTKDRMVPKSDLLEEDAHHGAHDSLG